MLSEKQGITIAGTLIVDVFHELDSYPKQGYLTTVRNISRNIGGTGNIILDLAKLDKKLTINVCALVGDDDGGKVLREILAQYSNVNTKPITVQGKTSTTLVMNAVDTKQRTFFFIPAASDEFCEKYIDWNKVDAKIFHLEYLLLMKQVDSPDSEFGTHAAKILYEAKKRGMITSIDVVSEQGNRASTVVGAALRYTDICCINEMEASAITGIAFDENMLFTTEKVLPIIEKLHNFGVSKWIVIHTPKIGYGYDCEKNELSVLPSLKLPRGYIKGTTGAGDAYCCGILYGAYKNFSLKQAMELARACATCSLSENNGSDGMRSYLEVMKIAKGLND